MNNARVAFEAGGTVRQLVPRSPDHLLHSRSRQVKNELKREGLSGRQIRKLRKRLAREERAERPPQPPPPTPGSP